VENGTITEFGSINLLKASEGYIAMLQLKAQSDSGEIEDLPSKEQSLHSTNNAAIVVPEVLAEQNEETQDLRRQTGDLSVYSYYSRAGGHGTVVFMLITVALWVFCLEFSGTLTQITTLAFVHHQCLQYQH
jgi:ATP-binding cassette subfamily C (CFTR/MRP) protein 1